MTLKFSQAKSLLRGPETYKAHVAPMSAVFNDGYLARSQCVPICMNPWPRNRSAGVFARVNSEWKWWREGWQTAHSTKRYGPLKVDNDEPIQEIEVGNEDERTSPY